MFSFYCCSCIPGTYHTQLAKMSFDEIFDLTAGVCFHFIVLRCVRADVLCDISTTLLRLQDSDHDKVVYLVTGIYHSPIHYTFSRLCDKKCELRQTRKPMVYYSRRLTGNSVYLKHEKIPLSCEIDQKRIFIKTQLCQLRVILRSQVLRGGVCIPS